MCNTCFVCFIIISVGLIYRAVFVLLLDGFSSIVSRSICLLLLFSDNELTEFLDSKKGEKGKAWLEKCRGLLFKFFTGKGDQVKGNGNLYTFCIILQVMFQVRFGECAKVRYL